MADAAILDWAVDNNHVLISKDRATIPPLVAQRLAEDIPSPHILIIRPGSQLNAVLKMIDTIIAFDLDTNWQYPIRWIP
jgi:hypothetical protein